MKRNLSVILILAGLGLGLYGAFKYGDSEKSISVAGIELSARETSSRQSAYLFIGLGLACLAGGLYFIKRK